jgi:thiaminase
MFIRTLGSNIYCRIYHCEARKEEKMKYENFEQASKIVKIIEKHQKLLDNLYTDFLPQIIIKNNYDTLITIGAWTSCEHEYTELAKDLINNIRTDLKNRISILKFNLDSL